MAGVLPQSVVEGRAVLVIRETNFVGDVAGSDACLGPHAKLKYSVQFSYDKGTPSVKTVRKAKGLNPRQPGRRKGTSAKADNLYDHGVAA